jgi:predicted ATPase
MLLKLRNIGMIETADIEINGVTIIAGENNSGKSTVSKALFSVFNSFYQIDKQITSERLDTVGRIISSAYHDASGRLTRRFDTDEIADEIIKNKDKFINDKNLLQSDIISLLMQNDEYFQKYLDRANIEGISEKIIQVLSISDYEILARIMQKKMYSEFSDQAVNVNNPDKIGEIILQIKDDNVKITLSSSEEITNVSLSGIFNLSTETIYIDDPFVIDKTRLMARYRTQYADHREHLTSILIRGTLNAVEESHISRSPIDEIIVSKKLEYVFEKLNTICSGEFIRKNRSIAYKDSKSGDVFDMTNVSTGLKPFAIIKALLLNGSIEENGTIILDEPESHLHPEWQLLFAELIVLLQKEFNLHILINTHSPYFLNALEVYSYKHDISLRCKYYLAENINKSSVISNVSNNIELIYEKLARPLQDLENMRYSND